MRYQRLGPTDLTISELGFGASPLGDVFSVVEPTEGTRVVHQAIDHGINFFDVSPYYGETLAEQRLGVALRGKRQRVVLATKCGRWGRNDFDFSRRAILDGVDASLMRLQTDYVDLLQIHDVEFGSLDQLRAESLPALMELQSAGKTRYIGVTGYPLKMLAHLVGTYPLDAVLSYCRHNLMVRDMDRDLTPVVRSRGAGLINASPLHMGLLSTEPPPPWHPAPESVRRAAQRAAAVCQARGQSLPEVALRFCLGHSYAATTLVGMASVAQLERNLGALKASDDNAFIDEITEAIGPELNYIWPSGRAENHD